MDKDRGVSPYNIRGLLNYGKTYAIACMSEDIARAYVEKCDEVVNVCRNGTDEIQRLQTIIDKQREALQQHHDWQMSSEYYDLSMYNLTIEALSLTETEKNIHKNDVIRFVKKSDKLERENKRLREALEVYAGCEEDMMLLDFHKNNDINEPYDIGRIAREALALAETEDVDKFPEKIKSLQIGMDQLESIIYLVAHELAIIYYDDNNNLIAMANMHDTFGYACSDWDIIPFDKVIDIVKECKKFPAGKEWVPLALWAQKECRSGYPFIAPVQRQIDETLALIETEDKED